MNDSVEKSFTKTALKDQLLAEELLMFSAPANAVEVFMGKTPVVFLVGGTH